MAVGLWGVLARRFGNEPFLKFLFPLLLGWVDRGVNEDVPLVEDLHNQDTGNSPGESDEDGNGIDNGREVLGEGSSGNTGNGEGAGQPSATGHARTVELGSVSLSENRTKRLAHQDARRALRGVRIAAEHTRGEDGDEERGCQPSSAVSLMNGDHSGCASPVNTHVGFTGGKNAQGVGGEEDRMSRYLVSASRVQVDAAMAMSGELLDCLGEVDTEYAWFE